jgi:hypothetical protein
VSALGLPHIATEQVVDQGSRAVAPPRPKIVIDRRPRGEVMRQHALGTATADDVEDAIEDFPLGMLLGVPAWPGVGDIRGDQGPLLIGQVTRIRFASVCWRGSHGRQPPADASHLHPVLSRNYCCPRPSVVLLIPFSLAH